MSSTRGGATGGADPASGLTADAVGPGNASQRQRTCRARRRLHDRSVWARRYPEVALHLRDQPLDLTTIAVSRWECPRGSIANRAATHRGSVASGEGSDPVADPRFSRAPAAEVRCRRAPDLKSQRALRLPMQVPSVAAVNHRRSVPAARELVQWPGVRQRFRGVRSGKPGSGLVSAPAPAQQPAESQPPRFRSSFRQRVSRVWPDSLRAKSARCLPRQGALDSRPARVLVPPAQPVRGARLAADCRRCCQLARAWSARALRTPIPVYLGATGPLGTVGVFDCRSDDRRVTHPSIDRLAQG